MCSTKLFQILDFKLIESHQFLWLSLSYLNINVLQACCKHSAFVSYRLRGPDLYRTLIDYILLNNFLKFSTDINECALEHSCQHRCINSIGSYLCACHEGYLLDTDGQTCIGPTGCLFDGILYPAGTAWTVDGCTECRCDKGVTKCEECPPTGM